MTSSRADRVDLFRNLESPASQPQFWARVAPDVDWTVEGTHALAGRYRSKQEFIDATFGRLDGDTIVEVRAYLDSMMVDYTIQRNELARQ